MAETSLPAICGLQKFSLTLPRPILDEMIKLQTPVIDQKCNVGISYSDKILLLGSCFADNIGQALKGYGFDVCVNPFGTLYNPASIVNAMQRLITGTPFMEKECVQMGSGSDLICSFSHHTSFARKTGKEFLENANSELEKASRFLMECDKIIITLGTAWFFRHTGYIQKDGTIKPDNGRIVANCLKRDAKEFSREMLDRQTAGSMLDAIAGICGCRKKKVIFTVSPIRHMADGAHGNMVSKSTIMLAVDDAIRKINSSDMPERKKEPVADYFPAYEIMMDELRDYRFYAEDMVHPSAQATGYILERFLDWALPAGEHGRLKENIKAFRQSQHRQSSR